MTFHLTCVHIILVSYKFRWGGGGGGGGLKHVLRRIPRPQFLDNQVSGSGAHLNVVTICKY